MKEIKIGKFSISKVKVNGKILPLVKYDALDWAYPGYMYYLTDEQKLADLVDLLLEVQNDEWDENEAV